VRGLASGFLVGVPVVFTADVWWLGDQTDPRESLVLLAASYALTLIAVAWIGFQRRADRGWALFADALEALAIAVLALVAIFWSLGLIGDGQAASIALGRIAVAVAPVSLGVAVANHLLSRDGGHPPDGSGLRWPRHIRDRNGWRQIVFELGAAGAASLFLCIAIVPVDDLDAIASRGPVRNLPVVILLSLLVSYSVVFASDFAGEGARHRSGDALQHPMVETVSAYLVALAIALLVLWLFRRLDAETQPFAIYNKVILLGFPASMAAAAGRLAI
jgi:putative integral membrane protein (TIGR02587 family)